MHLIYKYHNRITIVYIEYYTLYRTIHGSTDHFFINNVWQTRLSARKMRSTGWEIAYSAFNCVPILEHK